MISQFSGINCPRGSPGKNTEGSQPIPLSRLSKRGSSRPIKSWLVHKVSTSRFQRRSELSGQVNQPFRISLVILLRLETASFTSHLLNFAATDSTVPTAFVNPKISAWPRRFQIKSGVSSSAACFYVIVICNSRRVIRGIR